MYVVSAQPSDLVLQSFPFSYAYVDIKSLDGNPHSVQLYTDITGGIRFLPLKKIDNLSSR